MKFHRWKKVAADIGFANEVHDAFFGYLAVILGRPKGYFLYLLNHLVLYTNVGVWVGLRVREGALH